MSLESGWFLQPRIALQGTVVADLEKLSHIFCIEFLFMRCVERLGNEREVVVHSVPLRSRIDPIKVSDTLGQDERSDRAPGDGERTPLHLRPVWIKPRVANEIEPTLSLNPHLGRSLLQLETNGVDEHLRDGSAVYVHLLEL